MSEPEPKPNEYHSEPGEDNGELREKKFSYVEPFAGIIFTIIATVVFLVFPEWITVVFIGGYVIPTFEEEVIRSLWIPIILWAILRVGVEVVYLVEKCYTKRLAKITVIANILAAICTIIIFIDPRIVYWEYIDWCHTYFANISVAFGNILAHPHIIIIVLMMVVLTIESVNVIRKARKSVDPLEKNPDDEDPGDKGAGEEGTGNEGAGEEGTGNEATGDNSTTEGQQ